MNETGSTVGVVFTGEKLSAQGKTYPCATLCTTNPMCNAHEPLR